MNFFKNLIALSLLAASITTTTHAIPLRLDKDTYPEKKKNIRKKAAIGGALAFGINLCCKSKVDKDKATYFSKYPDDDRDRTFSGPAISDLREEAQIALIQADNRTHQSLIKKADDRTGIQQSMRIGTLSFLAAIPCIAVALCPQLIAYPLSLVRS